MNKDGLPTDIFYLIRTGKKKEINDLIDSNGFDVNQKDTIGNDVVSRLVLDGFYEEALKLVNKKTWNINNININGDSIIHILGLKNNLGSMKVFNEIIKKKKLDLNIVNNNNLRSIDITISNNNLYMTLNILKKSDLNNMDEDLLKKIFNKFIYNDSYGKYSKISNLETIIDSFNHKKLSYKIRRIINKIRDNFNLIKENIMNNNINIINTIMV